MVAGWYSSLLKNGTDRQDDEKQSTLNSAVSTVLGIPDLYGCSRR